MNKENGDIRNLKGESLDEHRPKTKLITKPMGPEWTRLGPGGVTVFESFEIPVAPVPVVEGVRAPTREVEAEIKGTPTNNVITDHRAVDDPRHVMSWIGGNDEKVITGQQIPQPMLPPSPNDLKRMQPGGIPSPTTAKLETTDGLLRRLLRRMGNKE